MNLIKKLCVCVMDGIILTYRKHLHNCIISLSGEVWVHKTSLTPLLFNEEPVRSQKSQRSCNCVLVVSILPLSTILLFDFGTVPRALYLVWSMVFSTILSNISVTVTISFNGGNRCIQRKLPTHYIHKHLIHHLSIGG